MENTAAKQRRWGLPMFQGILPIDGSHVPAEIIAGITLAAALAEAGLYVFTTRQAATSAPPGIEPGRVPYLLKALADAGLQLRLHKNLFKPDCPDVDWLPEVARNKWVLLTKDKGIRRRPIERQALLIPGARSFILTAGEMTGQEIAETNGTAA